MKVYVEMTDGELKEFQAYRATIASSGQIPAPILSSDSPIATLGLSVRALNCLLNIVTVGELARMPEKELLRRRNMGPKTVKEIREKLREARFIL